MQTLGTIISTKDSPSTSRFLFVAEHQNVSIGQYISVVADDGQYLAVITEIYKSNIYFENADTVSQIIKTNKSMSDLLPVESWEYLVVDAKLLGFFSNGRILRVATPPSPGDKVYIATPELLAQFLSFDENGIFLGHIENHNVKVAPSMSSLLQKHLAVLAMSGAGKSYAIGVLLEELAERTPQSGQLAVVVLDVHGEYKSFCQPPEDKSKKDYSRYFRYIPASEVKIATSNLNLELLSRFLRGLSGPQMRALKHIFEKLYIRQQEGNGPYTLDTLLQEVSDPSNEMNDATRNALYSKLYILKTSGLFSDIDNPALSKVAEQGKITVIDLSDIVSMDKKQMIATYFASRIFEARRRLEIPPTLIILEEAHQFIPESSDISISRKIFETIAREGRKFGVSLCVVSQRPIQLSTTVLSQCNTHMILRITNPYDLEHIGKSAEGLDKNALSIIPGFKVGEALLIGNAVPFPLFFKVRLRKSQDSLSERSLEQAAKDFYKTHTQLSEDAKLFM